MYVSFHAWLLAHSMLLRLIHTIARISRLFLLLAECTPLYEVTTICLSFHKLMSIYSFWWLWIKLQWIFAYSLLYEHYVFISLRRMWLIGHMVSVFSLYTKLPSCFPKCEYHFAFPVAVHEGSSCSIYRKAVLLELDSNFLLWFFSTNDQRGLYVDPELPILSLSLTT